VNKIKRIQCEKKHQLYYFFFTDRSGAKQNVEEILTPYSVEKRNEVAY